MTPNPTPADRLEAAIHHMEVEYAAMWKRPDKDPTKCNLSILLDAARAHLADLRREKVADSETPSTIHKPDSCLPAIHKDAVKRALELMERHWDGYSTAKEIITNAALLNKEIAE